MIAMVCGCRTLISAAATITNVPTLIRGHFVEGGCHSPTVTFVCDCGEQHVYGPGVEGPTRSGPKARDWMRHHGKCATRAAP